MVEVKEVVAEIIAVLANIALIVREGVGAEHRCLIVAAGQRRANVIQRFHDINEKIVNALALFTELPTR